MSIAIVQLVMAAGWLFIALAMEGPAGYLARATEGAPANVDHSVFDGAKRLRVLRPIRLVQTSTAAAKASGVFKESHMYDNELNVQPAAEATTSPIQENTTSITPLTSSALTVDRNLIVTIDGLEVSIDPFKLADPAEANQFASVLQSSQTLPTFCLNRLLIWSEEERTLVFKLMACFNPFWAQGDVDGQVYEDPLEVVLNRVAKGDSPGNYQKLREAARDAIAYFHSGNPLPACTGVQQAFKAVGQFDLVKNMWKDTAQIIKAKNTKVGSGGIKLREIFPDAPVPEDYLCPDGWMVNDNGIVRVGSTKPYFIREPVVIVRRELSVRGETENFVLAWRRDNGWFTKSIKRGLLASERKILELADYGCPVISKNAGELVGFIDASWHANKTIVAKSSVTAQMGWQGENGADGFLWGRTLINAPVETSSASSEIAIIGSQSPIAFLADEGGEQLADGYRAKGRLEDWLKMMVAIKAYPKVRLAILASLATPLLEILNAPNFIVDLAGETSGGKTSTLRLAASVWGFPFGGQSAAIGSWDATRTYIERAVTTVTHLPLILDDTKQARDPKFVGEIVFDVSSGRSRMRGSVEGMRRGESFRTIMLSSGEQTITSFTMDGGAYARTLTIWGSPFGGADTSTAALVEQLRNDIEASHGLAGPAFVRFLVENRTKWTDWVDEYLRLKKHFKDQANGNAIADRTADYLATLTLCASLACEALGLPEEFGNTVNELKDQLYEETKKADLAASALRHVYDWAVSHQNEFFNQYDPQQSQPLQGWAGRWDRQLNGDWESIGVCPNKLEAILKAVGFEHDSITRTWDGRKWLSRSKKRLQTKMRIAKQNAWLYAIKREAINQVYSTEELNADLNDHLRDAMDVEEQQTMMVGFATLASKGDVWAQAPDFQTHQQPVEVSNIPTLA